MDGTLQQTSRCSFWKPITEQEGLCVLWKRIPNGNSVRTADERLHTEKRPFTESNHSGFSRHSVILRLIQGWRWVAVSSLNLSAHLCGNGRNGVASACVSRGNTLHQPRIWASLSALGSQKGAKCRALRMEISRTSTKTLRTGHWMQWKDKFLPHLLLPPGHRHLPRH